MWWQRAKIVMLEIKINIIMIGIIWKYDQNLTMLRRAEIHRTVQWQEKYVDTKLLVQIVQYK